ncbi:MAG: integral rane sensor signal transduction histidine kinase, partial [Paenibacillus sp.]|nr:integral rane sensor signal transduction histidine kinase [Paenibacillus sp.]
DSRGVPLLKLLLQPLVENAILHGFADLEHEGLLRVVGRLEEGILLVSVEDNGCGIDTDRLPDIRERLAKHTRANLPSSLASPDDPTGSPDLFGLRNVVARMKLYYGEQSALTIESASGVGTKVELRIPLEAEEDTGTEGRI